MGAKAPNVLELLKLIEFINKIFSKINVVNIDLAELNLYNPYCHELKKISNKII